MRHHLTRKWPRRGKPDAENHVVQPRFEQLQQCFAGHTTLLQRLVEHPAELRLHEPVLITQLLLLRQADAVVTLLAPRFLRAVHAGRIRPAFEIFRRAENRLAKSAADANSWSFISCHDAKSPDYTRRRLGGRHPLCGIGVTSLMTVISRPIACNARIAASRPLPGPFTHTSISFKPCAIPWRAASCATNCAA